MKPPRLCFCRFLRILVVGVGLLTACDSGSGAEPFPVQSYLDQPESLLGNRYRLEGRIDSQTAWEEGVGRVLVIATEAGDLVPVFVPAGLEQTVNAGQHYRMSVVVRERELGGLIEVESMEKY